MFMKDLKADIIYTREAQFAAGIRKHKLNIDVLMERQVGLAEHADLVQTLEDEIGKLAEYDDKLSTLRKFFG